MLCYSEQIMHLMKTLRQFFVRIQQRITSTISEGILTIDVVFIGLLGREDPILLKAFTIYCKLLIHISGSFSEIEKDTDALMELIRWFRDVIVSFLLSRG